MGISFGSVSKKPYVGSKEVKEAYVGTQKVYSAAPPIYYGFLGTENDYVIAPWCKLGDATSIVKNDNIYRIALSVTSTDYGRIEINEIKGNKFKFITKGNNLAHLQIGFLVNGNMTVNTISGISTTDYTLKSYDVPIGTTRMVLNCNSAYNLIAGYFDAIRFENE